MVRLTHAAVCIFFNRSRQILLLNRNAPPLGFGLVGGKIDLWNESIIQGLVREVKEEISVDIDANLLTFLDIINSVTGTLVSVFRYDIPIGNTIVLSNEHSGYLWTDSLEGIPLAGNTIKFLELYKLDSSLNDFNDIVSFGKYKGRTIGDIYEHNPTYILWLNEKTDFKVRHRVLQACESRINIEKEYADSIEWQRTEPARRLAYQQSLLTESIDTPFGKAVHIGSGVYDVIDNEGNRTGKMLESDYGSYNIYNPED